MSALTPFHDLFQEFLSWDDQRHCRTKEQQLTARNRPLCPPLVVYETEGHIKVDVELPGIKKEDITINLDSERNSLTISGEFKDECKKEEKGRMYSDRQYGFFSRTVSLPSRADANKIQAKLEHGVLKVDVPITEGKGLKTITID